MARVITLRINEKKYNLFKTLALLDNRPLSNYIESATMKYIEEHQLIDDFEMDAINNNPSLQKSLKRGLTDHREGKGSFVEL